MFHILVVDDDRSTRRYLQAVLETEKYRVSVAENGAEALALLDREQIDLALVDVMMPVMDGYTFTKLLRESGSEMPVLMLTAKQLPMDERQGFLSGTDDYMSKPVNEELLLLRIKALLRRARIASERRLKIGEAVLDYDARTVSRPGETVELPEKEFMLLFQLLSTPGKIYTRIQLMDAIWGADSETGWETVTVHVGRLRKRFENWDDFSIESVRGLGYKAVRKADEKSREQRSPGG